MSDWYFLQCAFIFPPPPPMFNQWPLTSRVQRRGEDVLNCSDGERRSVAIQGPHLWLSYRKPFLYCHVLVVNFLEDNQEGNLVVVGGVMTEITRGPPRFMLHYLFWLWLHESHDPWPSRRHCPPQGSSKRNTCSLSPHPSVTMERCWPILADSHRICDICWALSNCWMAKGYNK